MSSAAMSLCSPWAIYPDESNIVRATGCVPLNLFNVLLVWRSQFAFEAKATEGMHVQLQRMARVAPRMGRALASDRMQIKLGDPISATGCCELHYCSLTEVSSQAHIHRFASQALLDDPGPKPAAMVCKPCSHMKPELTYRSSGFVQAAQPRLPMGAGHVYVFGKPSSSKAIGLSCELRGHWVVRARSTTGVPHCPGRCQPIARERVAKPRS